MDGIVVSCTVIPKLPVADALPVVSVAVQVTVVVPRPKVVPEGGLQLTVGVLTLSLAVAVKPKNIGNFSRQSGVNLLKFSKTMDLAGEGNNSKCPFFPAQFTQGLHCRCKAIL